MMLPLGLGALTGLGVAFWPRTTWAEELTRPHKKWTEEDLNHFLTQLNESEGGALMASIEKESTEYSSEAVRAHLNWLRYHTFDWRAHSSEMVDYHEIVSWVARVEFQVDQERLDSASTFELERLITERSIAKMWENLSPDQRVNTLKELIKEGTPEDGSELLKHLGQHRTRNQREYYVGLLRTAETCYRGAKSFASRAPADVSTALASRLQSFNVHPVLWVTAILIAIASIGYMLGRASPRKASVVITQMHLVKVAALEDAGVLDDIIAKLAVSHSQATP